MDNSLLFAVFSNSSFITFIQLTVFLLMLTVALRLPLTLQSPLFQASLLGRTLLSVNVLVPIAVLVPILLLGSLGVPIPTRTALIVLAASPGAPLLTIRAMKAGGRFLYAADLQVVVALLATITTPLILWLFARLLPGIPEKAMQPFQVLKIVIFVQIVPIFLGMAIRGIRASFADWLVKWVAMVSRVMFLGLVLVLLVIGFPSLFSMGVAGAIAIALFALACLAIGHFLGGPGLQFKSTLAIGSLARNLGLALLIARLNQAIVDLLPSLVAFAIVGALMGIAYSKWMTKRIAQSEGEYSDG